VKVGDFVNIITILILFLLFSLLYGIFLRTIGLSGLSLTRTFREPVVYSGDHSEMIETVVNNHPVWIPWLRVESRISPHLQFGKIENLTIDGEMYHSSIFTLMPYQKIIRRHKVTFSHRGIYNVGTAAMTVGDITGWHQFTREQQLNMQIIVFPRLLDAQEMPIALQNLSGEIVRQWQLLNDPFLIRGIRDYQIGDSIRDIHWPATARSQKLQVKEYDAVAYHRLLIVINGQVREDQWDAETPNEQEIIETLISEAATLCVHSIRTGMIAGFTANMPLRGADSRESAYCMPEGEADPEETLLTCFAKIIIQRTLSFITFIQQIQFQKDTHVIVFSAYNSKVLEETIESIAHTGISISSYTLESEGI